MKQKHNKRVFFALLYGVLLFSWGMRSQNAGIYINWDHQVGCQVYDTSDEPKDIFSAEIGPDKCIKVCENSSVTYTLTGNNNVPINATWNVAGGLISSSNGTSCTINWGDAGTDGSITFSMVTFNNQAVTKTICFEKMAVPVAKFIIHPFHPKNNYYTLCRNQVINFTNLSAPVNQFGQDSYLWDFADGTISSEINPSHSYSELGEHVVYLTATNACGCESTFKATINIIDNEAITITCPTVVCEGQTETYSLPFDGAKVCQQYDWLVYGGEPYTDLATGDLIYPVSPNPITVNQTTGDATVTWSSVDSTGFGYLTFYPNEDCAIHCFAPTTIKIPVIQSRGTIVGDKTLCLNQQTLYKLPQWPTTDFHWEVLNNANNAIATVFPTDQRNEVVVTPLQYGTFTLIATYYNTLLNCGGTARLQFTVTPPIDITGPVELCLGTQGNYHAPAGITTPWDLTNSSGVLIKHQSPSNAFSYLFNSPGTYTLTAGSNASCPALQRIIKVYPIPLSPVISVEVTTVVNGSLQVSNVAATQQKVCPNAPYAYSVNVPDPDTTYTWSVDSGTIIGATTGPTANITFNGNPNPKITVIATRNNCTSSPSINPILLQEIKAQINDGNPAEACANSYKYYQVNVLSTSTLYEEGESYTWSLSDPTLGSITEGQGTHIIKVLWNNVTAPQTVTLYVVINKCTLTTPLPTAVNPIKIPVTISPIPVLDLTATATSACTNQVETFTVNPTPTGAVTWTFGDELPVVGTLQGQTHSFVFTGVNYSTNVTVHVANPNGCPDTSTSATMTVAVEHGIVAVADLSSTTNVFCDAGYIDATLTATVSAGATIQWYYNNSGVITAIPAPEGTAATLHVTSPLGFGAYYFTATDLNCSRTSNYIMIFQNCPGGGSCIYTPVPQILNNTTEACDLRTDGTGTANMIHFAETHPTTDFVSSGSGWTISGPTGVITNYTQSTLQTIIPGQYTTFYVGSYVNPDGQICEFHSNLVVLTIPYIPDVMYMPICNSDNKFTLNLTDATNYYGGLTSSSVQYYWAVHNSNNWTLVNGPIIPNLNGGTYDIKIVVNGTMGNEIFPSCEKIITTKLLTTINPFTTIAVGAVHCYDTAVEYITNPSNASLSYLWTFEPLTGNQSTSALRSTKRTYPTSGPKEVRVNITNDSNCSLTLTDSNTVIPEKCFNGSIVATPDAVACKGEPIPLLYHPLNDTCTPSSYTWFNGQTVLPNPSNPSTIPILSAGVYWVKISNGFCVYDTPNRVTPTFLPLPTLKLKGPNSVCLNDFVTIVAQTNGSSIAWHLIGPNGPITVPVNNSTSLTFTAMQLGTYTATAGVTTTDGCSKQESFTFSVNPAPDELVISSEVYCTSENPLQSFHVNLTASATNASSYNWSNGDSGPTTTLVHGGPILVTASNGGCKTTTQIDVPKNPADYMWVFPTGCINTCRLTENGTLIGPRLPLQDWSWSFNDNIVSTGSDFTLPLALNNDVDSNGTYNLSFTSGACSLMSEPLSFTYHDCSVCNFQSLSLELTQVDNNPYCFYSANLHISASDPISITIEADNMIITPNASILEPNVGYNIPITLIPVGGSGGGDYHVVITGTNSHGEKCQQFVTINLPACGGSGSKAKEKNPIFGLAPNPAQEQVTLSYSELERGSTVALYDLLGRKMANYALDTNAGSMVLSTSGYPAGIYIVVVSNAAGNQWQQKLIINRK